jgi:hypothetical protein
MKLRKRYFVLLFFSILPFWKLTSFGDYCFSILDMIITGGLIVLFAIAVISSVFHNLYKITIKREVFNIIPVIFVAVFSVLIYISWSIKEDYLFKNKQHVFLASDFKDANAAKIILFDDNTFVFKTLFKEYSCNIKGEYQFKNDSLFLNRVNISEKDFIFDKKYYYNRKEKILIPKNETLSVFELND